MRHIAQILPILNESKDLQICMLWFDVCIKYDSYLLIILKGREPFSYFSLLFTQQHQITRELCLCL